MSASRIHLYVVIANGAIDEYVALEVSRANCLDELRSLSKLVRPGTDLVLHLTEYGDGATWKNHWRSTPRRRR